MSMPFGMYCLSSPLVFSLLAALPWALWVTEVDLDVGGHRESLVSVHLRASIPGERFVELLRQLASVLDERVDDRLRVFAFQLHQHHVSRLALDQRRDLAVAAAEDQVSFPMTGHRPILDRSGPLADRHGSAICPCIAVFCV